MAGDAVVEIMVVLGVEDEMEVTEDAVLVGAVDMVGHLTLWLVHGHLARDCPGTSTQSYSGGSAGLTCGTSSRSGNLAQEEEEDVYDMFASVD